MSNAIEKVKFYLSDIVYRFDKNKKITFGIVEDTYELAAESDELHPLQNEQISVLWRNSSREQVWKQSKVGLINRILYPGMMVRKLEKGRETQRGYCKEIKQLVTVQIVGTDKVVEHISIDRLQDVQPFNVRDAVCLGDKFGRVDAIEQMVTMQSKDGSVVEVLTSINRDLNDYWLSKRNGKSLEKYYAGQEVICVPENLEKPNWLIKTRVMERNMTTRQRFTVQYVDYIVIKVDWDVPSKRGCFFITEVCSDDIKKMKVLDRPGSNVCLKLDERKFLKLESSDVLIKKKDWLKKLSLIYRHDVPKVRHIVNCNSKTMSRASKIRSSMLFSPTQQQQTQNDRPEEEPIPQEDDDWWTEEEEEEEAEEEGAPSSPLHKGRTGHKKHYPSRATESVAVHVLPIEELKVTVVWQDGTEEKDIPSTHLDYPSSYYHHEFCPGEWVIQDGNDEEAGKYGVIQKVDWVERTAKVKWFIYSENDKNPQNISINEMSVYDLERHPKFEFPPGTLVKIKPYQHDKIGKVIDSCVEGYVKVHWFDGSTSNCYPQDLDLEGEEDNDFSTDDSSEEDDGQMLWETESIESYGSDLTDETVLQNAAARLDFVRSRIVYLKEAFRQHTITENFTTLKDLLLVYNNSSYLDKLLGTSFFSLKSKHFQTLLLKVKEKAKAQNIALRGCLFSSDNLCLSIPKIKTAEKIIINKMIKLENQVSTEIKKKETNKDPGAPTTPLTPDSTEASYILQENLCVELLSMLKVRMDLAYAEIISRIGGSKAYSVITKATVLEIIAEASTPLPNVPTTPEDSFSMLSPFKPTKKSKEKEVVVAPSVLEETHNRSYTILDEAPASHHYFSATFKPTDLQRCLKAVLKEHKLLRESLPPGVWVNLYGNRIDLLSFMIKGPAKTPFEDGLFLFDLQLSPDYPRSPPVCHYISYSSNCLNVSVEGKAYVSLLGKWLGGETEVWTPNSTLLQLIVSIQELIFVSEPYYNVAHFKKQRGTQPGYKNSRNYNEFVILKVVQSMKELILSPPAVFKDEIVAYFAQNGEKMCQRLEKLCSGEIKSEFPLSPVSKGFKLSLSSAMQAFRQVMKKTMEKNHGEWCLEKYWDVVF